MILHLIKWAVDAGEWVCGPTVFNRGMPAVGRVAHNSAYGRDRKQRLDVYVPPDLSADSRARSARGGCPLLIFIHGGAWIAGDKFAYTRICRSFAAEGFLTFNVNYRLWPRAVFPVPSQDAARAVRWACDRAAEFGGDASRVILAGDSAGAHLALSYAAALRKPELFAATGVTNPVPVDSVRGLVLFYGMYDCEAYARSGVALADTASRELLGSDAASYAERLRVVSPIRHLTSELPPCFVAAGERDFLYDQSVALAKELARLGVAHRALFLGAREYPTAWHAFLNFHRRPCAQVAMREALDFAKNLMPGEKNSAPRP